MALPFVIRIHKFDLRFKELLAIKILLVQLHVLRKINRKCRSHWKPWGWEYWIQLTSYSEYRKYSVANHLYNSKLVKKFPRHTLMPTYKHELRHILHALHACPIHEWRLAIP